MGVQTGGTKPQPTFQAQDQARTAAYQQMSAQAQPGPTTSAPYTPPPQPGSQTVPPTNYVPTVPAQGVPQGAPSSQWQTTGPTQTGAQQAGSPYASTQGQNPYVGTTPPQSIQDWRKENPGGTRSEYNAYRQAGLAGPLNDVFGIGNTPLRAQDVAMMQMNMAYQDKLLAEMDRQRGLEELWRGRGAIGQDPNSQYMWSALKGDYEGGGPFTEALQGQLEGGARGETMRGLDAALSAAKSGFARRGLGGGLTDYQLANMQSQAAGPLAQQIAQMRMQSTMANQAAMEQARAQLQAMQQQQAAQLNAADQAIANAYLETERAPSDFSALIQQLGRRQGGRAVST